MSDPHQTRHSICEITREENDSPWKYIVMEDEELFRVNKNASWEIEKVYTDYRAGKEPHKSLVVILGRKEKTEPLPINNADKIRTMTISDLAKCLKRIAQTCGDNCCPAYNSVCTKCAEDCLIAWYDWLNRAVEDD